MTLCGKGGHSRPLGKSGHSSGCKWLLFMRLKHLGHASKAATCGQLRPLDRAATCGHLRPLGKSGHLRPLEWLQVAAFYEIETPRPRVEGGHLRSLAATRQSGHLRPLEWLRVAASGCFSEIQIPRRMQPQWNVHTNILTGFPTHHLSVIETLDDFVVSTSDVSGQRPSSSNLWRSLMLSLYLSRLAPR